MSFKCCAVNCSVHFNALKSYGVHLRVLHSHEKEYFGFECTFGACCSGFPSSGALLKHLKNSHDVPQESERLGACSRERDQEHNVNENLTDYDNNEPDCQSDEFMNNSATEKECDVNVKMEEIFFKFITKLHQKSDMTKKCINEIYCDVKEQIIDPLCEILVTKDEDLKAVHDSFSKFNSQYKVEKYMKEREMLTKG
jgi:hypothetical protein